MPAAPAGRSWRSSAWSIRARSRAEAQISRRWRRRHHPLKGGVTVAWKFDTTGKVTNVRVVTSTLAKTRVEGCVVRQVQSWSFPSSDVPTVVGGFPFKFGVGGRSKRAPPKDKGR